MIFPRNAKTDRLLQSANINFPLQSLTLYDKGATPHKILIEEVALGDTPLMPQTNQSNLKNKICNRKYMLEDKKSTFLRKIIFICVIPSILF